jgi:hypothetical protein
MADDIEARAQATLAALRSYTDPVFDALHGRINALEARIKNLENGRTEPKAHPGSIKIGR